MILLAGEVSPSLFFLSSIEIVRLPHDLGTKMQAGKRQNPNKDAIAWILQPCPSLMEVDAPSVCVGLF